jgi:Flp pilus assembly pilin Flp
MGRPHAYAKLRTRWESLSREESSGSLRWRGHCAEHYQGVELAHPGCPMLQVLRILWTSDEGQDIAEYAVMLAVILVLVIGTIRLVGGNANNVFSGVASTMQ